MSLTTRAQFTHRINPDGTIDSICRQCCTTVAVEQLEALLQQPEREHVCDLALDGVPRFPRGQAR